MFLFHCILIIDNNYHFYSKVYNIIKLTVKNTKSHLEGKWVDFVVLHKPGVTIECLYYGTGTSHLITGNAHVEQGTSIEIGESAKNIVNKGWFILVTFDGREEYVLYSTIKQLIDERKMMLKFDIELEKLILAYQIDYALKERNKHLFYQLTKKLNSLDYTNSQASSIIC